MRLRRILNRVSHSTVTEEKGKDMQDQSGGHKDSTVEHRGETCRDSK